MKSENGTKNASIIDLNEVVNLIWDRAVADQDAPYFDFVKIHDQILMSGIKKYSMNIRKMDFSGFDAQEVEDMIERISTDLFDNITKANMDYLRHGIKMGARLTAEMLI